jgi:hypothetical protein
MAASVSEAASLDGVDVTAGRDGVPAGDSNFRKALRMDYPGFANINAKQRLLLRGYTSLPIEVWMPEPAAGATTPRENFPRGVLPQYRND